MNKNNVVLSITADETEVSSFQNRSSGLIAALPDTIFSRQELLTPTLPAHEALITSAEVVFTVQSGNLLPQAAGYNGHFEEDMRVYADAFSTMQQDNHRMIIGNRKKIEADGDFFDVLGEL